MIQKQIFFAWIGNELPIFTQNAIKWFKHFNPDFKINVIATDGLNLENDNEICIRKTYKYIVDILKNDDKSNVYYRFIKRVTNPNFRFRRHFMSYFTDILRIELLKTYGGIYLDCDTFPVRPFDDKLLSLNYFDSRLEHYNDLYFFGYNNLCQDYWKETQNFRSNFTKLDIKDYLTFTRKVKYYQEFKNGILTPDLISDAKLYIQHFNVGFWLNKKTNFSTTKYLDEYFGTTYN